MASIGCLNDLRPYGIEVLTGEACGLMMRVLGDFTERGRRIIQEALGCPKFIGAEPWNRGSDQAPHVGSIMLDRAAHLWLGPFALLEDGCKEMFMVIQKGNSVGTWYGWRPSEPYRQETLEFFERDGATIHRYAPAGTAGTRNRHEMTGRIS